MLRSTRSTAVDKKTGIWKHLTCGYSIMCGQNVRRNLWLPGFPIRRSGILGARRALFPTFSVPFASLTDRKFVETRRVATNQSPSHSTPYPRADVESSHRHDAFAKLLRRCSWLVCIAGSGAWSPALDASSGEIFPPGPYSSLDLPLVVPESHMKYDNV